MRCFTNALSLKNRLLHISGLILELGAVAQHGASHKSPQTRRVLIIRSAHLILASVDLNDMIVIPHVRNSHTILGQCTSLIRADSRRRSECLDGFQVLHQAVLLGHTLSRQGQAHSDSGEKTLRDVGDDDTDQEDDGIEPVVLEDDRNDEERDAEEDGHAGDDVDEMVDFLGDRGVSGVETRGEVSDTTHYGAVACADYDSRACAFDGVGAEEGDVARLEWVLVREFGATWLWFGLASQ